MHDFHRCTIKAIAAETETAAEPTDPEQLIAYFRSRIFGLELQLHYERQKRFLAESNLSWLTSPDRMGK